MNEYFPSCLGMSPVIIKIIIGYMTLLIKIGSQGNAVRPSINSIEQNPFWCNDFVCHFGRKDVFFSLFIPVIARNLFLPSSAGCLFSFPSQPGGKTFPYVWGLFFPKTKHIPDQVEKQQYPEKK
jgi:hypothetical protein